MKISRESLLKIKALLDTYRGQKYDLKLFFKIIEIIRNDKLFNNQIIVIKSRNNVLGMNLSDGSLHYSEDILSFAEQLDLLPQYNALYGEIGELYNKTDLFNYRLLFILFHELAHLKQRDYALKRESEFIVINKLYKQVFYKGIRNIEHYLNNPYDYVFEYNADIEAMRLLQYLFSDNIFLALLNNIEFAGLISSYYDINSGIFLAEKTLNVQRINDKRLIRLHNLPIDVLVHNGLPVDNMVLNEIYGTSGNINPQDLVRTRIKYNL